MLGKFQDSLDYTERPSACLFVCFQERKEGRWGRKREERTEMFNRSLAAVGREGKAGEGSTESS